MSWKVPQVFCKRILGKPLFTGIESSVTELLDVLKIWIALLTWQTSMSKMIQALANELNSSCSLLAYVLLCDVLELDWTQAKLFLLENSLWLMHTLNAQQKSAAARPRIFGQQMGQSWSYLHAWFPFSQLS